MLHYLHFLQVIIKPSFENIFFIIIIIIHISTTRNFVLFSFTTIKKKDEKNKN
jgi:hypothetical protein